MFFLRGEHLFLRVIKPRTLETREMLSCSESSWSWMITAFFRFMSSLVPSALIEVSDDNTIYGKLNYTPAFGEEMAVPVGFAW